jgi:hypothetical protein
LSPFALFTGIFYASYTYAGRKLEGGLGGSKGDMEDAEKRLKGEEKAIFLIFAKKMLKWNLE